MAPPARRARTASSTGREGSAATSRRDPAPPGRRRFAPRRRSGRRRRRPHRRHSSGSMPGCIRRRRVVPPRPKPRPSQALAREAGPPPRPVPARQRVPTVSPMRRRPSTVPTWPLGARSGDVHAAALSATARWATCSTCRSNTGGIGASGPCCSRAWPAVSWMPASAPCATRRPPARRPRGRDRFQPRHARARRAPAHPARRVDRVAADGRGPPRLSAGLSSMPRWRRSCSACWRTTFRWRRCASCAGARLAGTIRLLEYAVRAASCAA